MGSCVRCRKPLEDAQVDDISVRICPVCATVLLRHEDLTRIVDRSWRTVSQETAEREPLRPSLAPAAETIFPCPDCGQAMEKYGYMGMNAIMIDRCDACSLVWLDAHELQNIILAFARNQYRLLSREEQARRANLDIATPGMIGTAAPGTDMWLFDRGQPAGDKFGSVAF
jgi:Zn-finger nucleic acid-binding protein